MLTHFRNKWRSFLQTFHPSNWRSDGNKSARWGVGERGRERVEKFEMMQTERNWKEWMRTPTFTSNRWTKTRKCENRWAKIGFDRCSSGLFYGKRHSLLLDVFTNLCFHRFLIFLENFQALGYRKRANKRDRGWEWERSPPHWMMKRMRMQAHEMQIKTKYIKLNSKFNYHQFWLNTNAPLNPNKIVFTAQSNVYFLIFVAIQCMMVPASVFSLSTHRFTVANSDAIQFGGNAFTRSAFRFFYPPKLVSFICSTLIYSQS